MVLTVNAKVHFRRPVYVGETIFSQAIVEAVKGNRTTVAIVSKVSGNEVCSGTFEVAAVEAFDHR